MDEQQPPSPRARLQVLLAIPERQRTDAEWDEINELEITLATGNRQGAPQPGYRGNNPPMGGQQGQGPGGHQRPGGGRPQGQGKQGRKFHHQRPPKRGPR